MNYIKTTLLVGSCMTSGLVYAEATRALEGSLDDFVQELVAQEDQQYFREFYKKILCQHPDDKNHLISLGKSSLEVKEPKLSLEVKSYLIDMPGKANPALHKKAEKFLARYGALQEFLEQKATKHKSILAQTTNYFKGVGRKVSGWFSGWRSKSA